MQYRKIAQFLLVVLLTIGWAGMSNALAPPTPEQIEKYKNNGTLAERQKDALTIGNHKMAPGLAEHARYKLQYLNSLAKGRTPEEIGKMFAPPEFRQGMPTTGDVKMFILLVEFSDYAHISTDSNAAMNSKIFGAENTGSSNYPYESLSAFYDRSSYGLLNIDGATLGWYNPGTNRSAVPETDEGREDLIEKAITSFDNAGHDFSQYDNNNDGVIDYFAVIWAGPPGDWASFWWAYQTSWTTPTPSDPAQFEVDGKKLDTYSWQYESYDYPTGAFVANTLIHETGHALGLPDYYDYQNTTGVGSGVGGLDMMDSAYFDHNSFSKFVLDWFDPTVMSNFGSYPSQILRPTANFSDSLVVMPGVTGSQFEEYFIIEHRKTEKNDIDLPNDGLLIWHVNAVLAPSVYNPSKMDFKYDNSYTEYKLLRLMEADGLEEIENKTDDADAGDFYTPGNEFTETSTPNSNAYGGNVTGVQVTEIATGGDAMVCDVAIDGSSCNFSLSATSVTVSQAGGELTVAVDVSSSICSWAASENLSWLSVSPTTGRGDGTVIVTVEANSSIIRTGTVTIAGLSYFVRQEGLLVDIGPARSILLQDE